MELINNLLLSIKNPKSIEAPPESRKIGKVLTQLAKIFLLKLFISLFLILATDLLGAPDNQTVGYYMVNLGFFWAFVVIVIISPIYEETIFRLPLEFKPVYLAASLFAFCYFLLSSFIFQSNFLTLDKSSIFKLLFSFLITVFFYLRLFRLPKMEVFWVKNFSVIYILSIILFGLMHLPNFEITFDNFYFFPLMISPHLIAGVILNYVRMKFGFVYCCLFHVFNNLFVYGLSI